jgi:hypothetical protein
MDPILDKARAGQNALEQLVNAIPGFKGYRDKELRRDADRMQREYLASRLEETKKTLDGIAAAASRVGALDAINDVETARKRVDKVVARIRYADRGYAGFFATIKVDEGALDRVYRYDLSLLQTVDEARGAIAGGAAAANPGQAVQGLIAKLDVLDAAMSERETVLTGIQ